MFQQKQITGDARSSSEIGWMYKYKQMYICNYIYICALSIYIYILGVYNNYIYNNETAT